jgi:hypothetical protein
MFGRMRKRDTTTWEREETQNPSLIVLDAATASTPRFLESKASGDETDANGYVEPTDTRRILSFFPVITPHRDSNFMKFTSCYKLVSC